MTQKDKQTLERYFYIIKKGIRGKSFYFVQYQVSQVIISTDQDLVGFIENRMFFLFHSTPLYNYFCTCINPNKMDLKFCSLGFCFFFNFIKKYLFIYLEGRIIEERRKGRRGKERREKEIFYPLLHSPNSHIWESSIAFPIMLLRSWIRTGATRT